MPTVRLLGPVDVIDDHGVVHTPGSPLRCTLLALLALQPRSVVDSEALLDRIWDGRPPASGLRALRFHISRLRSELDIADLIVTVGSAYRLDATTDLVRLADGLAADTDADTLAALLATRRGDPFLGASGCSVLDHERRRLDELTLTITERLHQHSLAADDTSVIGDLTRLCLEHPVRESLWAVLIRAHYQAGNQADALRAVTALRINLRDELGVDLSRELHRLELQILDHDVSHTAPTGEVPPSRTVAALAGNLPHPLDSFIGRSEELGVLSGLIAAHRLVTVVGVGGMGKTRLVIEAFNRTQFDVRDGVWFIDLGPAQSDGAVVDAAASVFSLQASPGQSIEDCLVEHLESRTAVLVFDNCEHVMRPATGLIDRLLGSCPSVNVVATSREALMLRGEHVMALGPLPIDDEDDSSEPGAVALFAERLIAEGGSVGRSDDRAVIVDICRQLDGMPLAIELAAARARTLGVVGVRARLGESLRLLSGGWRTGAGRHQTLVATLDWSYDLLDEREQIVFDRLAVFVGWFSLDDAVAVATEDAIGELDVLESVSALVDKSMCTVDVTTTPARYRYLETMRAYGLDRLRRSGLLSGSRNRHALHVAAAARRIRASGFGPDELTASHEADRLVPDARAALGWAVEQHLHDVVEDIAELAFLSAARGYYEMARWCFDLRDDLVDLMSVQSAASRYTLNGTGDLAETRRLCHRAIERIGMDSGIVWPWTHLGSVAFNEGHYDEAVELHSMSYTMSEQRSNEVYDHVAGPGILGAYLGATGHDPTAVVQQALERAESVQWPTGLALAHYDAGLAIIQTDPVASLEELTTAVRIAADVENRFMEATAQTLVIHLQRALLPPGELASELSRLLRRLQEIRDQGAALLALSTVIVLLAETNRPGTAALIYGWLNGRHGRSVQTLELHDNAIAVVQESLDKRWNTLVQQGRNMTSDQIIDAACDELATIELRPRHTPMR